MKRLGLKNENGKIRWGMAVLLAILTCLIVGMIRVEVYLFGISSFLSKNRDRIEAIAQEHNSSVIDFFENGGDIFLSIETPNGLKSVCDEMQAEILNGLSVPKGTDLRIAFTKDKSEVNAVRIVNVTDDYNVDVSLDYTNTFDDDTVAQIEEDYRKKLTDALDGTKSEINNVRLAQNQLAVNIEVIPYYKKGVDKIEEAISELDRPQNVPTDINLTTESGNVIRNIFIAANGEKEIRSDETYDGNPNDVFDIAYQYADALKNIISDNVEVTDMDYTGTTFYTTITTGIEYRFGFRCAALEKKISEAWKGLPAFKVKLLIQDKNYRTIKKMTIEDGMVTDTEVDWTNHFDVYTPWKDYFIGF